MPNDSSDVRPYSGVRRYRPRAGIGECRESRWKADVSYEQGAAVKHPVHESEVGSQVWYQGTDREISGKALCDAGGKSKIGFGLLELPPGCNTKPGHWHSMEEEHLFVLSGDGTLHLGEHAFDLRPGSYVCFPAGQELAHYLENNGAEPFRYIMVGERIADDQVTYPPGAS